VYVVLSMWLLIGCCSRRLVVVSLIVRLPVGMLPIGISCALVSKYWVAGSVSVVLLMSVVSVVR